MNESIKGVGIERQLNLLVFQSTRQIKMFDTALVLFTMQLGKATSTLGLEMVCQ